MEGKKMKVNFSKQEIIELDWIVGQYNDDKRINDSYENNKEEYTLNSIVNKIEKVKVALKIKS